MIPGRMSLHGVRPVVAEFLGTAFLLATVVGSGIMGERLANGNAAMALLANSIATGGILFVLILTFGPLSGANFNPLVTLALNSQANDGRRFWSYLAGQLTGGFVGVASANLMFGLSPYSLSQHERAGMAQMFSEFVATFGLLLIILLCGRFRESVLPYVVAAYITAAYWFTASTSFANPVVTLARAFTDTFSGIRLADVPGFIVAQVLGAAGSVVLCRWLILSKDTEAFARKEGTGRL
jgi:glycerol uptake facilitator-like aquaporin